jgi:hypothetical protein
VLVLAGIWEPDSRLVWFVPITVATIVAMGVLLATRERSLTLVKRDGRSVLYSAGEGATRSIHLDELASVARDDFGDRPILTLVDLQGGTMSFPLGFWTNEDQLMDAVRAGVSKSGAKGDVGTYVHVPTTRRLDAMRIALGLVTLLPLVVLVRAIPEDNRIFVEPVSLERLHATAGETAAPFAARKACDIYLVPADRPSVAHVRRLRTSLAQRLPADICTTPSMVLADRVLDQGRAQIDADLVLQTVSMAFRAVWRDRPSMTIAVTTLDMFTSARPDLRFTFGTGVRYDLQSHASLSLGRMEAGDAAARRLETMALRYIGYYYFGLPFGTDPTVALGPTIGGLDDLDRMRPEFSDPPPSDEELAAARERLLGSG